MGKFKKLAKLTRKDVPTVAMIFGGSWLIATACQREGARAVINQIKKNGLKVVDANGETVDLMLKPLIHID